MCDELLEQSRRIVGNARLCDAAAHHPVDAWRVWASKNVPEYTEESEVSNAVCAEPTLSQDLQAVSCPFKAPTSLERRHYARVSSLSACNRIDPELGML